MMGEIYIGLMSGTSIDGADGVLIEFEGERMQVLAHAHRVFDPALRTELLALNTPGDDELHRAALAANALARVYAQVVTDLRQRVPGTVRAIAAHGQTVRHRPGQFDGIGYTLQINAPALLAELTGIAVVADLRSRDVAAGGQGAPLVPAFHRACFGRDGEAVAVVNIGGISNLTLLPRDDSPVRGFDCGPGNALMDLWCLRHRGLPYDDLGRWAASGAVRPDLLAAALRDPYFALPPPKSTGRDDFHAAWLDGLLATTPGVDAQDVQATLCELTARVIAQDLTRHLPAASVLLVCGGGALNQELMRRVQAALPQMPVQSSGDRGLPPLQVEAAAFAWLGRAHLHGRTGSLKEVTGAAGPRVLGALYPA
ncbi:anhydro-N-acetylmuramic acid kinase [Methylibium sp. Root1272]|uniref:anhydro-N-acetylmuramic acid kinase n=1 Tax=Methylibium sp. Root1272 TaxID=1736441 RepID=UPI0019102338|nr:anhydro-N-acetylmuramic acid kinase [Methylibium sp. Root1272]